MRSGRFVGNKLLVVEIVNQAIEHGLRQIDGEHTVATFCQRDNVPPGSAAKVRHDAAFGACRSNIWVHRWQKAVKYLVVCYL